jgi:hypothetical protein
MGLWKLRLATDHSCVKKHCAAHRSRHAAIDCITTYVPHYASSIDSIVLSENTQQSLTHASDEYVVGLAYVKVPGTHLDILCWVKLISLCAGIADKTLLVEGLSCGHDLVTADTEVLCALLLQLECGQRCWGIPSFHLAVNLQLMKGSAVVFAAVRWNNRLRFGDSDNGHTITAAEYKMAGPKTAQPLVLHLWLRTRNVRTQHCLTHGT